MKCWREENDFYKPIGVIISDKLLNHKYAKVYDEPGNGTTYEPPVNEIWFSDEYGNNINFYVSINGIDIRKPINKLVFGVRATVDKRTSVAGLPYCDADALFATCYEPNDIVYVDINETDNYIAVIIKLWNN